jgi:hypothetical protein
LLGSGDGAPRPRDVFARQITAGATFYFLTLLLAAELALLVHRDGLQGVLLNRMQH